MHTTPQIVQHLLQSPSSTASLPACSPAPTARMVRCMLMRNRAHASFKQAVCCACCTCGVLSRAKFARAKFPASKRVSLGASGRLCAITARSAVDRSECCKRSCHLCRGYILVARSQVVCLDAHKLSAQAGFTTSEVVQTKKKDCCIKGGGEDCTSASCPAELNAILRLTKCLE